MVEVIAKSKYVRISPKKMRLVAAAIRGLSVKEAEKILKNLNKRASLPLLLTLKQAVGNAVGNFGLVKDTLIIKKLEINKGPSYKRGRPVSRGQWHPILKRTCHITMVVEGDKVKENKKEEKKKRKIKGVKKGEKNGTKS